jgi:hypothetical protein
VDVELRQILETVAVSGPASRVELRDVIEQRGGRFSGCAVLARTKVAAEGRHVWRKRDRESGAVRLAGDV